MSLGEERDGPAATVRWPRVSTASLAAIGWASDASPRGTRGAPAKDRPAVGAHALEQQAPGGSLADAPARHVIGQRARFDGIGHRRRQGTLNSGRK
jgi:hypothetical protein